MSLENEFVPYTEALVLKELGFDEQCLALYDLDGKITIEFVNWKNAINRKDNYLISASLYQQAFRWFREKYKLHSTITSISQESWQWHITRPGESLGKLYEEDFYTYEEAELECLKKLIELCKKN